MLTNFDKAQMQADLRAIRDDRPASIVVLRGSTTLAAQTVRVARVRRGQTMISGQGREQRADVLVMGDTTFDIQVNDRFSYSGALFRIFFVRPNRDEMIVAEALMVE